jgi:hypothetical protein
MFILSVFAGVVPIVSGYTGVGVKWHFLKANCRIFVIPAQAGIQEYRHHQAVWMPSLGP